jgi:hypothetical protein
VSRAKQHRITARERGRFFGMSEHTTTTAALHQVRWRLIPVANDSPVVFHFTEGMIEC